MNAQSWERDWWGSCTNTYAEETKQWSYAHRMGLLTIPVPCWLLNLEGSSILDIGGGPVSFLLKCSNVKGKVVDPCEYPDWIASRYHAAGIKLQRKRGEDMEESGWDEVWLYNVLQHVEPSQGSI